jgi:uncharacterized cupin superfamily protein
MADQARLADDRGLRYPETAGWFVVNARESVWWRSDDFGATCFFEGREEAAFPEVGIRIRTLWPGQPNGMYHSEQAQEDFLVLFGECLVLIEGEERRLQAWDFVHCPPGTEHIFVGAGEGPCVILMVGARHAEEVFRYPVSELAQRHGAGVDTETADPDQAYARFAEGTYGPMPDGALPD